MKIDSVKPGVPKKATYLSLIVVMLFLAWLAYAVGINHMPVKNTAWALTPPIIAISLALITKEVYSSLFIGILTGGVLYSISTSGGFPGMFKAVVQDGLIANIADSCAACGR